MKLGYLILIFYLSLILLSCSDTNGNIKECILKKEKVRGNESQDVKIESETKDESGFTKVIYTIKENNVIK